VFPVSFIKQYLNIKKNKLIYVGTFLRNFNNYCGVYTLKLKKNYVEIYMTYLQYNETVCLFIIRLYFKITFIVGIEVFIIINDF